MSNALPDLSSRQSRWPLVALVVVSTAALWCLDTHQPPPWPEAATPWFAQLRALAAPAWIVDRANAFTITPDLPLASAAIVIALGALVLAATRAIGVPPLLALATALGIMTTRSVWSTVTSGADALWMAAIAGVVLAAARDRHRSLPALSLMALIVVAPWLVWLALPVAFVLSRSGRARLAVPAAVVTGAACLLALTTWRALGAIACADDGLWRHAVLDVALPGISAQASSWIALRQAVAVGVGDVHLFGVALAVFGGIVAEPAQRRLRQATLAWVGASMLAVAAGLLPPALAAAAQLPWWAPWSAVGALAVVARVPARQQRLAMAFMVVASAGLPLLRHATVVPGPWVSGEPALLRATAPTWRGMWLASEESTATRRWRAAGIDTVPADAFTLTACLKDGRRIAAIGPALRHVEQHGFLLQERPVRAPLAALLGDVRRDQLVALGLSGPSLSYLGSAGLTALARLGLDRGSIHVGTSLAALTRTDVGGLVEVARDGTEIELRTGDSVAGRQLVDSLTVHAHNDRSGIDSPPRQVASGTVAAIAVFDRAQEILLRAAGDKAPGLPFSLVTLNGWQHATVSGPADCASGSAPWLDLHAAARIGVPLAAASPRRPLVAYVASAQRPRPAVSGLPIHPVWHEWDIEVFDPGAPAQAAAVAARAREDGLDAVAQQPSAWWARIAVRPRDPWHLTTATLVAGTPGDWWVQPAGSQRAWDRSVCRLAASGERLLFGQYGAVDDDSPREVNVWAAGGWHAPERIHNTVHQWSAQPAATVGFHLGAPADLVLAMDASPGSGPLTVAVNGTVLVADWQVAGRVEIPAARLRTGENILTLSVADVVRTERDPRPLGVLVRQLRLLRAQ